MTIDQSFDQAQLTGPSMLGHSETERGGEPVGLPRQMGLNGFVLIPAARMLLRNNEPLDIGSRAFDLLTILIHWRGRIVPKQTIISFVWPTTIVDESNLRFQMALLRKVLGRDRDLIKTIQGRGYLLAIDCLPCLDDVGDRE